MQKLGASAPTHDQAGITLLRADFTTSNFTVDAVESLLGPVASAALHREQKLPALRAARLSDAPLATLIRLFMLGDAVTTAEIETALPQLGISGAVGLGILTSKISPDDVLRSSPTDAASPTDPAQVYLSTIDLRPYSATDASGAINWWFASDQGELVTGTALRPDHVLGAGGASLTLAQITIRTPQAAVLDLGTGCGIQALHALRHSDHVTATDISARALAFTKFNAALAGMDDSTSLETIEGSMLEPVSGKLFNLVVSNPPFVITPRVSGVIADYEYRDGGRNGDDLVRDLVRDVEAILAPGGVVQMLGNWEHHGDQPWQERVAGWLEGTGLDVWVVQRELLDPAEYAETWIRDGGLSPERDLAAWETAYQAWLDDFAGRGVSGVGLGFFTLRKPAADRPSREPWRKFEERSDPLHFPLGEAIAGTLDAVEWLAEVDDQQLLDTAFITAADVSEERFYEPGAEDPRIVILRQGGGFGRSIHASSMLAAFVGASDGDLTAGQIIAALASLTESTPGEISTELIPAIRGLVEDLLLTPAP